MKTILITGGAGFIGCNAAASFLADGYHVVVFDNLSRKGTPANMIWLEAVAKKTGARLTFMQEDVRNAQAVDTAVIQYRPDALIHLAAQVAVTTSVLDPRTDFEINAMGTLNVLEAVRRHAPDCFVVNSSTNKVYGHLSDIKAQVSEKQPLQFFSPYGCSKGVADQYVMDYARIYGLKTVTMRQSCIYGKRQFGVEDQGWVAWFMIAASLGKLISIYGDGKQVRDILCVDDLIECYRSAIERQDKVSGHAFNIGGGPNNAVSLLELLEILGRMSGAEIPFIFQATRPGDQPVYVSDISKANRMLGWTPKIGKTEGLEMLYKWVRENVELFAAASETSLKIREPNARKTRSSVRAKGHSETAPRA